MTHKQIANRLREIIQGERPHPYTQLELLADTLDPPRPEPREFVLWRYIIRADTMDFIPAIVAEGGDGVIDSEQEFHEWCDIEWKPARILAPNEVAVKVPPTQTWGHRTTDVEIVLRYWDVQNEDHSERVQLITRAEAEAQEAGR
jgi:hypothetical protein